MRADAVLQQQNFLLQQTAKQIERDDASFLEFSILIFDRPVLWILKCARGSGVQEGGRSRVTYPAGGIC